MPRPPTAAATDWIEIVGLYNVLLRIDPSPVIELNRAVAVAMRDGPEAGLRLIDAILERGELREYRLAHAARAELCRRLGRTEDARVAYERALALTRQEPERRFLEKRLEGSRHVTPEPPSPRAAVDSTLTISTINHEVSLPGLPGSRQAPRRSGSGVPGVRRRSARQRHVGRGRASPSGRDRRDRAGAATARCRSPMARSPRRKNSSPASIWSKRAT